MILLAIWSLVVGVGTGITTYALREACRDLAAVRRLQREESFKLEQTAHAGRRRELLRLFVQGCFVVAAISGFFVPNPTSHDQVQTSLAAAVITAMLMTAETAIVTNSVLDLRYRRRAMRTLRRLIKMETFLSDSPQEWPETEG